MLPPRLYDCVQRTLGLSQTFARLAPHLQNLAGSVLDVGGGTGLYATLLPRSARYICLDNDAAKLQRLKAKSIRGHGIVGDAATLPFRPQSVDNVLCIAVSHHLCDETFRMLLREMAALVRFRLVFLDAVWLPGSPVSRALWALDDGNHPRSADALLGAVSASFSLDHVESYAVWHRYILCAGSPKRA